MIVSGRADALRREHWFGVLVELFITVAGILIAPQVDNWIEKREQADEARVRRAQIIEKLQGTRDDLSGRPDDHAREMEFAETAFAAARCPIEFPVIVHKPLIYSDFASQQGTEFF